MKNVAVLMPGHLRSYNETRQNIKKNLLDVLTQNGYTYNIFSSTWNISGYREINWAGDVDIKYLTEDSTVFEIENNRREEFTRIYNNDKWREYSHLSGPETCGDAVSMWYKIERCYKMMITYHKFKSNINQ